MTRNVAPALACAWLLAALLAPRLSAQTPVDTAGAVKAAEGAAQTWLAIVDKGQFAQSWDSAAAAFQHAVTKPQWEEAVRNARAPFEPFGARQRTMARYSTELPNAPPGPYVVLQYQTSVAAGHQVVETLVSTLDGSRCWRISGYFIKPQS